MTTRTEADEQAGAASGQASAALNGVSLPGEPAGRGRKVALEHGCSIGTGPLRQTNEVKAPRERREDRQPRSGPRQRYRQSLN
ncbi:hypothetical protein QMZ30_19370 [Pantoea sp. EA-12]|uniref:hypothetical protein n=1 Tax=Pantoea sp. EA-12 TaxID=3043303 RepID=UPI0024B4D903|nr:hypothetical protein [Pantoea sp. EA-12]MDI9223076.1 hypothetical protein [Pantoea sp. EA-12]